jgi:hypothetical protein
MTVGTNSGAATGTPRGGPRGLTRPPTTPKAGGPGLRAVARLRATTIARRLGPPPDLAEGAVLAGPATPSELPGVAQQANPSRAPWLVFAIVSIALFMSSLDGTIVATGLPILRRDLHTGLNWTAWTITAYQLGIVVAMPMAGRLEACLKTKE